MFRPADPSRRIPVYLQAYTKENFIWQLKLTGLLFAGTYAWACIEAKREEKKRKNLRLVQN